MGINQPNTPWRVWIKGVAVAMAVFGAIYLLASPGHHHGSHSDLRGQAAPPFELKQLGSATSVSLASLQGKPVILNFWAAWCAPCIEELPLFERLHRDNPHVMKVITVSADDPVALERVLKRGGYTLPCLLDSTGTVSARYKVDSLPRTIVIDSDGVVLSDQAGQLDMTSLKGLLQGLR